MVSGFVPAGDGGQGGFSVARLAAGVQVIEVRCEVDLTTASRLAELLSREFAAAPKALVVDLAGCDFMGSAGLAALVKGREQAEEANVAFALAGLNRTVARALQATGLTELFTIYATAAASAVAALGDAERNGQG